MEITIEERKSKRTELLKELYNYFFEKGGAAYKVAKKDILDDREKELALMYLEQKNLITIDRQGNNMFVKMTVYGIDAVEN